MQPPKPSIEQRLRIVRRRVAAGVLATFVVAWLAVAALGKGGASSSAASAASPSSPSAGSQSQSYGDSGQSYGDSGANAQGGGPVTSSQS